MHIHIKSFRNYLKAENCKYCIYIATCEEELNWHIDDEHNIQTDPYFETDFPCEICGKYCRTEADLTYHLKKHELENPPCKSQPLGNENIMLYATFVIQIFTHIRI